MDDNQLIKIAENRTPSHLVGLQQALMRKLNIDIAGEQACWMKYRTCPYKKKKMKKKKDSFLTTSVVMKLHRNHFGFFPSTV